MTTERRYSRGMSEEGAPHFADSAVPLVSLARDSGLLLHEFEAKHGKYFIVRASGDEHRSILGLTKDQTSAPSLSETWVYKLPPDGVVIIGRVMADLCIADATLDAQHATLDLRSDPPTITDCGSVYGTWMGFESIPPKEPTPVRFDRDLRLGMVPLLILPAENLLQILRTVYRSAA